MAHDEARVFMRRYERDEIQEAHALPMYIHLRPSRDAVEVAGVADLRQSHEVVPPERERLLAGAIHDQAPASLGYAWLVAEVQHRPFFGQILPGRKLRHAM